ncbi:hypothetical protein [uncultured Streptomyces sp.]|uniref:hypothetical protein n=1 Tax=uncultured Streptomyces sp. TaxID=174707 RepID=UPI00262B8C44|nr:hypothetical protein [uncultured Streptomyces sp.]
MTGQITEERASAGPVPGQGGGRALMRIPHREPGVEEDTLPWDYERIITAVRQVAGPVTAREVGEVVGVDVSVRAKLEPPTGPGDCDVLQVFWCPFNAHGPGRHDLELHLRRRWSGEVGEVLTAAPQPLVVGSDGFVPEPCVLHPEQVVTYPFAGLLPEELCARIDAWEEALEEEAERSADETTPEPLGYQYDLSIPPGWRVGGFASWHATDPYPMDCLTCTTPMHLLLTIDSSEWDGGSGSWKPLEDQNQPTHRCATPTAVTVGRWGELNVFACPNEPEHPHRWSVQ